MDYFGYGAVHKQSIPFRYEAECGCYMTQPEYGIDFGLIALSELQIRAFAAIEYDPPRRLFARPFMALCRERLRVRHEPNVEAWQTRAVLVPVADRRPWVYPAQELQPPGLCGD